MDALSFFGKEEWKAIFAASFALLFLFTLFLISKIILWIAFGLVLIAFIYSGYRLFFDKKNRDKGEFSELMESVGGVFKSEKKSKK